MCARDLVEYQNGSTLQDVADVLRRRRTSFWG